MIVVMRPTATQDEVDGVKRTVEEHGLEAFLSVGEERTVIGVVGSDIERVAHLGTLPGVEQVIRISSPYKLASVEHQVDRTRVRINGVQIGEGQELVVIAGPCAVESREQLFETARCVKREGARVLRGGAFKPRTSPYSFQGLGLPALKLLAEAHESTGMPVVSEVVDPADVPAFEEHIDVLQVGARNMHNFVLLKAVGQSRRPVLLKRGLSATIEEWLLAAEYVMSAGNPNVILCERGIRTFETATRNTLDLSAVPVLRGRTHLPIIVDPSHGTGHRALVAPMALASAAVGADGLIIEVHPDPANARSDGDQSLSFEEFGALMDELRRLQFVRSADSRPSQPASLPAVAADGIEEVRDRIDDLDARLAALVQERAALALEVQRRRAPDAHGHDVHRERALLERAASGTDGPMTPVELTMVFDALLRASRAVQRRHAQSATEAEAATAGPGG
jgi:3-deoxy-7-phosphoheptulonate synthase